MNVLAAAVPAAALVVGLTVLLTRRTKLRSFGGTLLSVAEVAVVIGSAVALRWWGLVMTTAVLMTALLVWSVILAIHWEAILVGATARGRLQMNKKQVKAYARRLRRTNKAFRALSPIELARLIQLLSELGHDETEITAMAPTVAKLWIIYEVKEVEDQQLLTRKFDQCVRCWGKRPDEADSVADVLVTASKSSPASFSELLDGMIAEQDDELTG